MTKKKDISSRSLDSSFYHYWFTGINRFLEISDDDTVDALLQECARSCSDSYSREVFQAAFSGDRALPEALEEMHRKFTDFSYSLFDDHIEIRYAKCGCDLVNEGFISSRKLYHCSELSLWDNLTSVGTELEKIVLKESILAGDARCSFEVYYKKKAGI